MAVLLAISSGFELTVDTFLSNGGNPALPFAICSKSSQRSDMGESRSKMLSPMQLLILEHGAIGAPWGGYWQVADHSGHHVGRAVRALIDRGFVRIIAPPEPGQHTVLVATKEGVEALRLETIRMKYGSSW